MGTSASASGLKMTATVLVGNCDIITTLDLKLKGYTELSTYLMLSIRTIIIYSIIPTLHCMKFNILTALKEKNPNIYIPFTFQHKVNRVEQYSNIP